MQEVAQSELSGNDLLTCSSSQGTREFLTSVTKTAASAVCPCPSNPHWMILRPHFFELEEVKRIARVRGSKRVI